MNKCPNCGKQNQPLNQFCDDCGAELPKQASAASQQRQTGQQMILCPQCRAASPMGSKICTRCQMPFPLSISAVLNNRYQIDTFLSRGGMGAIYNLSRLSADRYNSAAELKIDLQKRSVSTTRTCSRCQSVNQIREPYCQKCGTQLSDDSRSCPNCRQSIPQNAKFCIHCGHKLAA